MHNSQSAEITSNVYMKSIAVQGVALVVLDEAKASSKDR
jgi:hypothetical protein